MTEDTILRLKNKLYKNKTGVFWTNLKKILEHWKDEKEEQIVSSQLITVEDIHKVVSTKGEVGLIDELIHYVETSKEE